MSYRRITLKADYPVKAGSYEQKVPPKRKDRVTPAWAIQEERARFLEIIRLTEIPIWEQYRQQVQSESLRARKEYYGEAYGTMVVPEFEAHVKSWEQQQYASLKSTSGAWKVEQVAGFNISEKFYSDIGYPQYAGKYEPFQIPEGYKVSEIKRTDEGLQIFFTSIPPIMPTAPKGALGGYTVERDPLAISKGFYTEIGYPQYAGKYDPFLTLEGFKVSGIKETGEGLQVSFESTTPKGIAQQILEFDIPTFFADVAGLKGEKRLKYLGITSTLTSPIHILPKPFGTPVESLAGLVSYPETLGYAGMTLIGFEPPTRPPPPPGISEGFTMGYAMGIIGTSLVMGKLIEISPLGKPLAKLEMGIMSKIREPIIGTGLDKFLLKHSSYWATLQEYKAGSVVFGGTPKKWSPLRFRGKTITPMSVTLKKAISDTSGSVLLPKLFTTPKILFTPSKTVSPFSLFSQTLGATITLGAGLLAAPITKTRTMQALKPKHLTRKKASSFPVLTTRETQQPGLFELSKVFTGSLTGQSQKTLQTQIQKQIQTLWQPQRHISIVTTAQLQKQMQKQVQALSTLTHPSKPSFKFEYPRRKRRKRVRKKKKGKTGRYKRAYPLMTPKQMLKKMVG